MKKFFTFVAALMAVASLNATQVVLMPANMPQLASAGAYDTIVSGIRVKLTNGIVNTTEIRIYKNQTLTLSADSAISAIEFTCTAAGTSKYGPGCFEAQTGYSYDQTKGTWVGDSVNSVSFKASTDQVRASKIVVYLGGEKPSEEQIVADTISVHQAVELIKSGAPEMLNPHYVKGVVAGDPFVLNNIGPAFYMTDIDNPLDSLEGFKIDKDANNTAFADLADMEAVLGAGDTIMIYANGLALYNNKIYETTSGYFVEMLGKSNAIILNWSNEKGSAFREDGTWELEIKKVASSNNDKLNLIFSSDKENAIAGFHALNEGSSMKLEGANLPIASGSVQLSFKSVNDNGYNVYEMKVVLVANDQMYRLNQDIEFFASKDGDEIVLVGDRPFKPTVDGQAITCAQAKEYALTLDDNETSELNVSVTGFVTDLFADGESFWMDDKKGSAQVLQAFKFNTLTPSGVKLKKGAKVKVFGKVTNYQGKAEIKNGAVEILEGGEEIEMIKVNVAEALEIAQKLDTNKVTTELYEVEAFIASIATEYSSQFGNISLWLTDNADDHSETFQAYRAKCDSAIVNQLVAGTKIYIVGNLKHHYSAAELDTITGDSIPARHAYEVVNGKISLPATAVENVVVTKDEVVKFFKNGQIYIRRNDGLYNLQGIKVD